MDSTRIGGAPVTQAHYSRFAASLTSSIAAALIGGVIMLLVLAIVFMSVERTSFFYALRPIGTFLYGDRMLVAPTPAMYAASAALHFGIAALWGIAFAFAATLLRVDKSVGGSVALGIVLALTAHIVDVNIIAPALQQSLWGQDLFTATMPPLFFWLGHIAFGLSFVIAPLLFHPLWLRWSGADLSNVL